MFSAIFQHHVGYLAACTLTALVLGGAAWALARRLGNSHSVWWSGLAFTVTGVLGVTLMDGGSAGGVCVLNHQFAEPFHTTQGWWNLAMMVPVGLFALLSARRPLPVLVAVIAMPLGIEFTQATVDGLGRVCDSSDAEMNIIGGLAGVTSAVIVLTVRRSLVWQAGAKGALIASAALLLLGSGVARPMLDFTNVDGTGLSAADADQKRAVEAAVDEALGDRYEIDQLYEQPCGDLPCTNIIFNLHSREKGPWPRCVEALLACERDMAPRGTGRRCTGTGSRGHNPSERHHWAGVRRRRGTRQGRLTTTRPRRSGRSCRRDARSGRPGISPRWTGDEAGPSRVPELPLGRSQPPLPSSGGRGYFVMLGREQTAESSHENGPASYPDSATCSEIGARPCHLTLPRARTPTRCASANECRSSANAAE
ncbi:VanZ family protein [Streptomyces sp. NPDC102462]|uniref:VanZ family protein n=1 Tax=Streptomyces sp. NPDC102462 TaxID=3366178 RepID=UPI0037F266EE